MNAMKRKSVVIVVVSTITFGVVWIVMTHQRSTGGTLQSAWHLPYRVIQNHENQDLTNGVDTMNTSFELLCTHMVRLKAVERLCKELKIAQRKNLRNPGLMVQPEANVGYCEISKVGSTNMKRVFARSTTKGKKLEQNFSTNWHNGKFLRRMGMKSDKAIGGTMKNLTRFFILRHPFDRLISAYNSKLGPLSPGNGGYEALSKRIIKINNPKLSTEEILSRRRCTFPEFIHALANRKISLKNNHWVPFALYCNPCHVDYSYIIRIESLSYDAEDLMEKLGVSKQQMSQSYAANKRLRFKEPVRENKNEHFAVFNRLEPFADVPKEEIKILEKMYWLELKLYGYTFDLDTLKPGCMFEREMCC